MGISVLYKAVDIFFEVIYILIFVRIILSWISLPNNSFSSLIYSLTEPILGPVRRMLNRSPLGGGMMLDFSPIIALFFMNIAKLIIYSVLGAF
ncbi:MAG: YggT family protein [Lachnospiraceae bacterium]|nr:YggT family protein [Lachnospiraceae bacterium]